MGLKIRELLDGLEGEPLKRLCEIRGVTGRSLDERREALARSYRGDHTAFLDELRKKDLVFLLSTTTTTIDGTEYYLPSAASYPVEDLVRIASKAFFSEGVPSEFESLDDDEDQDDDDDDDDDDGDDDDGDDGWEVDEDDHDIADPRGYHHGQWLQRELTYSPEEVAAKRAHPYQDEAVGVLLRTLGPDRPQLLHLATGGGKTLVANNVVVRWLERQTGPVLWVTKDWRLLLQAARDLRRRHPSVGMPTRIGGDGRVLHPLREAGPGTSGVVYTTIHTLLRRLDDGVLRSHRPSLLVWDESHWGEHSGTGHIVTACSRARIPVLGLTATPRINTRYDVAFSRTYHQLVSGGFLAKEVVHEQRTGVSWMPQRQRLGERGGFGDVTQASLIELARDRRRNELIVRHYLEYVRQYGKTIVFACTVEHATKLAELFLSRGVAARPVHHQQDESDIRRSLDMFSTGQVQVLVNVAMLTHGIDVPDARSVFLCRPTTSDILFAQMIGRACRRDEATGKTTFNVVEFTDNVSVFADVFQSSKKFFQGAGGIRPEDEPRSRPAPGLRPKRHAFDPTGAATWIPDREGVPEAQRGLWYRQGQTFGVEIELTCDGAVPREPDREWRGRAEELRQRLAATLLGRVAPSVTADYQGSTGDKETSVWNVEFDGSAGWEVTSRVLSDIDGFTELDEACRVIDRASAELGLLVNHRTGLHVHLGWLGRNVEELKRAVRLAKIFEPAVATLVAPSRIARFEQGTYDLSAPNVFCRPVSSVFGEARLARLNTRSDFERVAEEREARHVTFNVKPLEVIHTVEVRMHSGTIEARKILPWISLWMQILWSAANQLDVPEVQDRNVIVPDGDVVALALQYLPDGRQPEQQAFLRRLAARRAEVVQQWARHPNLRPWLDHAMRWTFAPGGIDES